MRIVFMGTPDFAEAALKALIEAGFDIACVVTQPDREKGRGREVQASPVKTCAMAHGIPVLQPDRVRDPGAVKALASFRADVFVVAAFGQILPQKVLDIPRLGCVNIHASLLPRYRGAAPIQHAILNGDAATGITIMKMDAGMDTGDILYREEIAITEEDTGGTLFEKLSVLGASCIVKALPLLEQGLLTPVKQDEALQTNAPKITKESGRIDWNRDAESIARRVRAFDPWPGAFTTVEGKAWKITGARAIRSDERGAEADAGCVLSSMPEGIRVRTGAGDLLITELQPAGKRRMAVIDFLNGHTLESGTMMGT